MNKPSKAGVTSRESVVAVINPSGAGRVVLACEHASNAIPAELGDLGLDFEARNSHIAWDCGALAVAKVMSAELDAVLVAHRVSRLVYDCNRAPNAIDAIPSLSEYQEIPGNAGLSDAEREARTAQYYTPFCDALSTSIEQRSGVVPMLITVHSFTPVYKGEAREVEIGILHDSDTRLADEMLKCAADENDRVVMRNMPYGPDDGVTFTLTRHAVSQGLMNVMIEIRNDLVTTEDDQNAIAKLLSGWVREAIVTLEADQKCEALQS